jgi:hypothetical protein
VTGSWLARNATHKLAAQPWLRLESAPRRKHRQDAATRTLVLQIAVENRDFHQQPGSEFKRLITTVALLSKGPPNIEVQYGSPCDGVREHFYRTK